MQILSLNINGFSGIGNKNSKNLKNQEISKIILKKIFDEIDPEIIILSEFDVNSFAGNYVIEYFERKGYYCIFPNGYKYISKSYTSIVVIFTKKEITSEKSLGIQLKWNEIKYGGYRIIGVHVPDSTKESERSQLYWKDILSHYQRHKTEKIIYIGDMNVYIDGTFGKEQLNKLINIEGAKDAWIEKKSNCDDEETYTYVGKTRIDYAIVSPSAYENLCGIENIQVFFKEKLSDHSAILIDLKRIDKFP